MKPPRRVIEAEPKQMVTDLNLILGDIYKRFGQKKVSRVVIPIKKVESGGGLKG